MSKFEFKLPDIGEGVSEGEIVSWLVKTGDSIAEDQDMVEVMTDKATVTIGAPTAGTVAEIKAGEGDTIPVGQVIIVLEASGEAPPAKAAEASPEQPKSPETADAPAPAAAETVASAVGSIKDSLPGMSSSTATNEAYFSDKPLAAPATRKLARELGVDLRNVPPSGEAGRVTAEDVQRFSGGASSAPSTFASTAAAAVPAAAAIAAGPSEQRVPIRGMRKRIYESMARSKHTAAHFTYVDECECTDLIALRKRLKPAAEAKQVKLSFLPFIIKAVVATLKKHPSMNCLVDDASGEMVLRNTYDIGLAVATDAGLIVPVIRNADQLNMLEIAGEIERLANDARVGKTKREDLGGSSFTVTSLGKAGGLLATPVVNYPEVGILFVPEMKKKPVVKDDQIVVGHVMALSLSFDHRIIDGHVGAAFTQDVIELLQSPDRLFLEI